jgi:hypothetical protein
MILHSWSGARIQEGYSKKEEEEYTAAQRVHGSEEIQNISDALTKKAWNGDQHIVIRGGSSILGQEIVKTKPLFPKL